MTNYTKGRKKEYDLMHKLKEKGYHVLRSAGSHSDIDIVAVKINKEKRHVLFFQCKPDDMSDNQAQKLLDEHTEWQLVNAMVNFFIVRNVEDFMAENFPNENA